MIDENVLGTLQISQMFKLAVEGARVCLAMG